MQLMLRSRIECVVLERGFGTRVVEAGSCRWA